MGINTVHTETIAVRVTPKIRDILVFQAEKKEMGLSEYVRSILRKATEDDKESQIRYEQYNKTKAISI